MEKEIWVRADVPDSKEERKNLVLSALESGIDTAIVRPGDEDFAELGKVTLRVNDNGDLSDGYEIVELSTPEDQDRAMAMAGKRSGVILDSSDWTVIPLENLIAKFRNSGTKVFACAADKEQAKLYMQTLEKGVDGIVVSTTDPNAIRGFAGIVSGTSDVELTELEVLSVKNRARGPGQQGRHHQALGRRQVQDRAEAPHPPDSHRRGGHVLHDPPERRDREARHEGRVHLGLRRQEGRQGPGQAGVRRKALRHEDRRDQVLARLESGGRHFGMKIDETIREI